MSPVAAPERPLQNNAGQSGETTQADNFDAFLAGHPDLTYLGEMNETNLGEPEQAAVPDKVVEEQPVQVRTDLAPPPAPPEPPSATPPTSPSTPANPTPTVPGTPSTSPRESGNDEPFNIVVIDRSVDAKKMARSLAEQRLSKETHEGGLLKKAFNTLWRNGVAHEWYRQKYIRQAHEEIVHHQDVLRDTESTESARKRAEEYLFMRFELGKGYISKKVEGEDGEQHNVLGGNSQLGKDLKDLIREAVEERNMSVDAITAKYDEIIKGHRDAGNSELFGAGEVTSHNIHIVIEKMRDIGLHGESLIHAVQQMRVISGESRSASRTEAHYNAADKAIEWFGKRNMLASVAPEAAVAVGVALAFGVAKVARGSLLKTVGFMAIPGVSGAILGALRGRKIAKDEIAQNEENVEFGDTIFTETDKRRKKLEKTLRDRKTASEMIDSLQATSAAETLEEGGDDALKTALKALAEVNMRQAYYDKGHVVMTWSSRDKRDEEAFLLTSAKISAGARINERLMALSATDRTRLGIADNATLSDVLSSPDYEQEVMRRLDRNIKATNKERRKYILGQMAVHGALGGVASLGLSVGVNFMVEHLSSSGASSGLSQSVLKDQGNGLKINGDYSVAPDRVGLQMGNYDLKGPDGKIVLDSLQRDSVTGKFDDASLTRLHDAGFEMKVDIQDAQVETKQVSIDDYINKHPSEFQKLDTQWMDNNTAQFDLNEQGGRFVANPDGTVTIGQNMTADGSFHGNMGIDMTDPARGQNVIDMAFKQPDGTFLHKIFNYGESIPKPWADMLYQKQDGTWGFKGNGHVSWGKVDGETFYSAASIPGDGEHLMLTDIIETTPAKTTYEITAPAENNGNYVGGLVYTLGRNRLTAAKRSIPDYYRRYGYSRQYGQGYGRYGRERGLDDNKDLEGETMPDLLADPSVKISPRKALDFYKDLTEKKRSKNYVDEINRIVDGSNELKNLPPDLKRMFVLPVNASGEVEANNIYRLLTEAYAKQDGGDGKELTVLLHVNWYDDAMSDGKTRRNIEKTRTEIERAKKYLSGKLNIATFETVWEREEYGKKPIIGFVAQRLNDVALFAQQRAMAEGKIPDDRDILLVRNDADAYGIHTSYSQNLAKEAEAHPETDIFTGTTGFDPRKGERLPDFVFVSNFMQSLDLLSASFENKSRTVSANYAIRSSALAATGSLGFNQDNFSGAGSDDGVLGERIEIARRGLYAGAPSGAVSGVTTVRKQFVPRGSRLARRVVGMRIDSDSDRMERVYLMGVPIIETWSKNVSGVINFDENGHASRTSKDLEKLRKKRKINIKDNPREVVEQMRKDMEVAIAVLGSSPAIARTALALAFAGMPKSDGDGKFHIDDMLSYDSNGKPRLRFSESDVQYLVQHLDGYGKRKVRQMYKLRPKSDAANGKTPAMMFSI